MPNDRNQVQDTVLEELGTGGSYAHKRVRNNLSAIADLLLERPFPTTQVYQKPRSLEIHPVSRCVNKCSFCIGKQIAYDRLLKINEQTMRDLARTAADQELSLTISGNQCEPFLNPHLKALLWQILGDRQLAPKRLAIFSTCYLLDDEMTQSAIANSPLSVYLGIGLYGYSADSYLAIQEDGRFSARVFQRSLQNITHLATACSSRNNVFLDIHYVVTPATIEDLDQLKCHMEQLFGAGVHRFMFNPPLRPIDYDGPKESYGYLERAKFDELAIFLRESFPEHRYLLKPWVKDSVLPNSFPRCYVQYFFPAVGPDCGLYPCCYAASPQGLRCGLQIGQLGPERDFISVWQDDSRRDFVPAQSCPACSKDDFFFNDVVTRAAQRLAEST